MNDDPVAAALAGGQVGDDDEPDIYSYKKGQTVDWPFRATVNSIAGESRDGGRRKHTGVDFGGKRGTPVPHPTSRDGIVTEVGSGKKIGNFVRVDDGVWEYSYGHLDKVDVTKDGHVKKGQQLGLLGATGNATGPNVHITKRPSRLGREGVKARLASMNGSAPSSSDPVAAALAGTPPASSEPFKSDPGRMAGMLEMAGDVATRHESLGKNKYETPLGTEYTATDGLADSAHAVGFRVPRQQQQRRVVRRVAAPVVSKEARALGSAAQSFGQAGAPIASALSGVAGAIAPFVGSVTGPKAQGKIPNAARRNRDFVTGSIGRAPGEPATDSINASMARGHDPRLLAPRIEPSSYLAPSHSTTSFKTGKDFKQTFDRRTRASAAPVSLDDLAKRKHSDQWSNAGREVSTYKGLDALAPPSFNELVRRDPDAVKDPLSIPMRGMATGSGEPVPAYKSLKEYYAENPDKAPPGWGGLKEVQVSLIEALTVGDPVGALTALKQKFDSSPDLDYETRETLKPLLDEGWRKSTLGKAQRELALNVLDALMHPAAPVVGGQPGHQAFEKSEQLRAYGRTPEGKAWLKSLGWLENPVRGIINGMGSGMSGLLLNNLENYQPSLQANPNAPLPGSTEFIGSAANMVGKAVPQLGALALGGAGAGALGLEGAAATSVAGGAGLYGSEYLTGQDPNSPVAETSRERDWRAQHAGALGLAMGPVSAATAPFLDPLVAGGEKAIAGVAGRTGGSMLNRAGQKVAAVVEKLAVPSRIKSGVDMFGSTYAAAMATGQPLPSVQEGVFNAGMAVLTGPEWNRFHTAKAIKARAADVEAGRAPKPPASGDVVELGRAGGEAPVYGQIEHISPNGAVTVRLEDGKSRFLSPKSQETTGMRVLDPQHPEDHALINQLFPLTADEGPRGGVVPIAADPVAEALTPTLGPEHSARLEAAKTELESVRQQIRDAGGSETAPMDLIDRALDLRLEIEELAGAEPMVPGERTLGRSTAPDVAEPDPVARTLAQNAEAQPEGAKAPAPSDSPQWATGTRIRDPKNGRMGTVKNLRADGKVDVLWDVFDPLNPNESPLKGVIHGNERAEYEVVNEGARLTQSGRAQARAELAKVDKQIAELEARIEATGGKKSPLHLRKNLERLQIKRETLVAAAGLETAAHPSGSSSGITSELNAETPVATSGPGNRQSIIRRPTDEEWASWNDDQKRAHNEQVHQALRVDPKTGAGNHVSFREAVEHVRASGREPTVTVADLNALHAIQNALGGHAFGDAIIQAAVDALHEAGLLPHRIGGDEFAIVGTADVATQQAQVDRALELLRRKQIVGRTKDGRELDVSNLSWSHGTDVAEPGSVIVERGQQAEGAKDVLGGADAKLYEHKTSLEGTDRAPRNPDGSPASRDAIPPSLNVRLRGDAQTRGDRPGLPGDQGQGVAAKKGGAPAPPEPPARRQPTFDELDDASSQAPTKGSVKLEIGGQKYTVNSKGEVRDWTGNLVYHPDAGVVDGPHLHTDAKDGSSSIDRPAEESADSLVYPERVEDAAHSALLDPLLHVSQPERAPQGLKLNPAAAALFRHLLGEGSGHDITQTYALTLPMDVLPEMIGRAEDLLEGGTLSPEGTRMVDEALDILRAMEANPDGALTFTLFNIDDVIAEAKKTGDTSHLEQLVAEEIAHGWQWEDVYDKSGRLDAGDWLPPDVAAKMPFRDKIRNFLIDIGYGNKKTHTLPDRVLLLEATAQFFANQKMGLTTGAERREFARWLKAALTAEHGADVARKYVDIPVDVGRFMRDYGDPAQRAEMKERWENRAPDDLSPSFSPETAKEPHTLGRDNARGTEEKAADDAAGATVHEGSGRSDEPVHGGENARGRGRDSRRDGGGTPGERGKTLGRSRHADELEPIEGQGPHTLGRSSDVDDVPAPVVEGPRTLGRERTVGKVTDLEPDLVAAERKPRTLGPSSAPDEGPAGLAAVRSPERRGPAKGDTDEHVYFEIAPSKSTKYAAAWHAQDNNARARSSRRIADATLPKILDAVGLGDRGLTIQHTVGGFLLETNPSTRVSGSISRLQARKLAAAIGYTYRQDSVLVARLDSKIGTTDYMVVTFDKGELTTEQADKFFQHLGAVHEGLGGGYAVKDDSMLLLNVRGDEGPYSGLDQAEFDRLVRQAAESYDAPVHLKVGAGETLADVVMADNDWEVDTDGEGYARATNQIGRPAVARALGRIREQVDAFHDQIAKGGKVREDSEEDSVGASTEAVGLAAVRREEQQRVAPKDDDDEYAPGRSRFERTPEFKQFFEKSAVAEEDGTPLVVSHYGHVKDIEIFDRLQPEFRKKGKEDDFDSVGNWFAVNRDAKDFGPEGYHAYLSIQNPKRYTSFRAALADFQAAGGRKPLTFRVGYPAKRALAPILAKVPGVTLEGSSETGVVFAGTRAALVMLDREIEREQRHAEFADRPHFAKARAAIDKALIGRRDGGHPDGVIKDGAKKWRAQLKAEGYDGIIISEETGIDADRPQTYYVTLEPTQIKQISNAGTFDKSNPNSLAAVRRPEERRAKPAFYYEGERAVEKVLGKLKGDELDATKLTSELLQAGASKGDIYELGLEDLIQRSGGKRVNRAAIEQTVAANHPIVNVKYTFGSDPLEESDLFEEDHDDREDRAGKLATALAYIEDLERQYAAAEAQLRVEAEKWIRSDMEEADASNGSFFASTGSAGAIARAGADGAVRDVMLEREHSRFYDNPALPSARVMADLMTARLAFEHETEAAFDNPFWRAEALGIEVDGDGNAFDENDARTHGYAKWSHPGGYDYRVLSFTMPMIKFGDPHFEERGSFAHVRVQTRRGPDGLRYLEIIEIQSDLHQAGREDGYISRFGKDEDRPNLEQGQEDAPFKTTWYQFVLKEMLRRAIEEGHAGLLINTGPEIAKRFSLDQVLKSLEHRSWTVKSVTGEDVRQWEVRYTTKEGKSSSFFAYNERMLRRHLGKELTAKVIAGEGAKRVTPKGEAWGRLEGEDLQMRNEGMRQFYDKNIPDFLNKYARRMGWSTKVEKTMVPLYQKYSDVRIVETNVANNEDEDVSAWVVLSGVDDSQRSHGGAWATKEAAEAEAEKLRAGQPVEMWQFPITDEMRKDVIENGQPIGLAALRRPLDRSVIGKLNQSGETAEKSVKQRRENERVSLERLIPQLAKVGAKLLVAPEVTTRAHWKAAMEKRFGKQFSRVHAQVYNEALEIFGAEARAAKVSTSRARGLALRKAAGGALEPNRLELFKTVLEVERTRGDEASLASIASHLEAFIVGMSGRLEPLENPNAPQNAAAREKRVARAAAGMEMELARVVEEIQAERHTKTSSGLDWYKAAIRRTVRVMTELYPTLADPDHALLFKILLGPTSPNEKPFSNLYKAAKLYEGWLASAKSDDERVFPLRRKNGKRWGFVGLYGALHRLEGLIRMYGFKGALAWLKKKHPLGRPGSTDPNTLRYWKPSLAPADLHGHLEAPGLFIFGPKAGPFASNILGLDYLTVDLWATRTYNSLMGTLVGWDTVDKELEKQLDKAGTWGEENVDWRWHPTEEGRKQRWAPIEQPRNEGERQIIIDAFVRATESIARKFNVKLKVPDAQALLWFAEQYLYRAHGAKNESWTFDQAALEYVRQHGILANARGIQPRHTAAGSRVSGVAAEVHVPRPRTIRRAEATPAGTAPGSAAEAAEKANSVVVRLPAPGVTGVLRLNPPAAALVHQLFGWGPASEIDWTGRVVDIGLLQDMLPRLRTMATSEHLSANARQRAAALLAGMTDIVLAGGKGEKRAAVSVELRNLDGLSKANAEKTLKELELRGIIFEEMYKRHESRKDGSILKETKKARLPHQKEVIDRLEDEGYAYTTENAMLLEVIPRVFGNNETFGLEGKALIDLRAALGRILKENIDDATAKRFRRGVTPDLSTLKGAYPRPGRKPIELAPDLSPSEEEEEADQERAARAQRGGALAAVRRAPRPFFYGAAEKAREILSKQKGEAVNPDAFLKAAAAKQIPKGDLVELGLAKLLVPGGRSIPKDYLEALIAANEMEVEVVKLGASTNEATLRQQRKLEELTARRNAAFDEMTRQKNAITDAGERRSVTENRTRENGSTSANNFEFLGDLIESMRTTLARDHTTKLTYTDAPDELLASLHKLVEQTKIYYRFNEETRIQSSVLSELEQQGTSSRPQYGKYAPTDKVDYFELLFRLPVRTLGDFPSAKELMSPEAKQELDDMDQEYKLSGLNWEDALRIGNRGAELTKESRDADAELSSKLTAQAMYTAPHWATYAPRTFAHARASIREINGKRYLEAHELQSDLLQAYRKYGIKGQPPPEPEPLTEFPKGDQFVIEPRSNGEILSGTNDRYNRVTLVRAELTRRAELLPKLELDLSKLVKMNGGDDKEVRALPGFKEAMKWLGAHVDARRRLSGYENEPADKPLNIADLPPFPQEFVTAARKMKTPQANGDTFANPDALGWWYPPPEAYVIKAKTQTRTGHRYVEIGRTDAESKARGREGLALVNEYLQHQHRIAVQNNQNLGVPDVPFKTTWHEFILKRLIQVALDAGLDGIIIDNGATVSHFLSLEREVSKLTWTSKEGETTGRLVALGAQDGSTIFDGTIEESQLPDYIGAELTTKLLATKGFADSHTLSGDGLKVEGKGQKEFYDGKLLNFLNKYSRRHQWGAKVEETRLRSGATTNSFHVVKVMQPLTWDDGAQLMHLTGGFYVTDLERMWRKVSSLEAIPTELPKDTVHPYWTELVPKDKGFRATIYRTGEGLEAEVTLDQNGLTRFLRKIAKDALGDTPFDDLRPLDKGWLFEFTDKLKEDILEHGQDVSLAARRRPARAADTEPKAKTRTEVRKVPGQAPIAGAGGEPRRPRRGAELDEEAEVYSAEEGTYGLAAKRRPKLANDDEMTRVEKAQAEARNPGMLRRFKRWAAEQPERARNAATYTLNMFARTDKLVHQVQERVGVLLPSQNPTVRNALYYGGGAGVVEAMFRDFLDIQRDAIKQGLDHALSRMLNLHAYDRAYKTKREHMATIIEEFAQDAVDQLPTLVFRTLRDNGHLSPQNFAELQRIHAAGAGAPSVRLKLGLWRISRRNWERANIAGAVVGLRPGKTVVWDKRWMKDHRELNHIRRDIKFSRIVPEHITEPMIQLKLNNLLSSLDPDQVTQLNALADRHYALNRTILDTAYDAGIISAKAYATMTKRGDRYVPLSRIMDVLEESTPYKPTKDGLDLAVQKILYRLKGSEKYNVDPIIASMARAQETIREASANLAALTFIELRNHDPMLGAIIHVRAEGEKLEAGMGELAVFDNGKVQKWVVPEAVAREMHLATAAQARVMGQAFIGFVNHVFKAGATGANLAFAFPNVVRDVRDWIAFAEHAPRLYKPHELAKATGQYLASMYHVLRKDAVYREWLRSGAAYSTRQKFFTPEDFLKTFWGDLVARPWKAPLMPIHAVTHVVSALEETTKLTAFRRAKKGFLKEGFAPDEAQIAAAYESRTYGGSHDFAIGGSYAPQANLVMPFIRARLGGTRRAIRTFSGADLYLPGARGGLGGIGGNPNAKRKGWARLLGKPGIAPVRQLQAQRVGTALFRLFSKMAVSTILGGLYYQYGIKPYEEDYKKIPPSERDSNWVVFTDEFEELPNGEQKRIGYKIPMSHVDQMFFPAIISMYRWAGGEPDQKFENIVANELLQFSPVGINRGEEEAAPRALFRAMVSNMTPLLRSSFEQGANWDTFRDMSIESAWMQEVDPVKRFVAGRTSPAYIKTAEYADYLIRRFSNGKQDYLINNPIRLQKLVEDVTGGASKMGTDIVDAAIEDAPLANMDRKAKIPILGALQRRFIVSSTNDILNQQNERFYRNLETAGESIRSFRRDGERLGAAEAARYLEDPINFRGAAFSEELAQIARGQAILREGYNSIAKHETMSIPEKRAAMKELVAEEKRLLERAEEIDKIMKGKRPDSLVNDETAATFRYNIEVELEKFRILERFRNTSDFKGVSQLEQERLKDRVKGVVDGMRLDPYQERKPAAPEGVAKPGEIRDFAKKQKDRVEKFARLQAGQVEVDGQWMSIDRWLAEGAP